MKSKKLLTVILVAALLAGCSKGTGGADPSGKESLPQENQDTTAPASPDSEDAGEELNSNLNLEGFPIVKEKETFSLMGSKAAIQGPWDTLSFFTEMEEKTNITFTFDTPANNVFEEKKNLSFAGNSYPDVFFAANMSMAQQVKYGMSEGILLPLDEYIDKYCPNIQKMFAENPDLKKSVTAPDGHIYSLPNYNQGVLAPFPSFWYNQEWLDALGVTELPKDIDSFYNLLTRFKNEDPNKNGIADEIPFTMTSKPDNDLLDINLYLLPAFGITSSRIYVENDKVKFGALEPNYKEYLYYINKLMSEGLIDNEWVTQDEATMTGKTKGNMVGMAGQALPQNLYEIADNDVAATYLIAPALSSSYSNGQAGYRKYNDGIAQGAFSITNKCKNPAAMMRWVDYLYGEEGSLYIYFGNEGIIWQYNDKGQMTNIQPENGMTTEEYRGGFITPDCGSTTPKWVRALTVSNWEDPMRAARISQVEEKLVPYSKVAMPSLFFTPEQQNQIDTIKVDIDNYMKQSEAAFFVGNTDVDREYDNFVKQLNNMGVQDLINAYQEAYDSWNSVK